MFVGQVDADGGPFFFLFLSSPLVDADAAEGDKGEKKTLLSSSLPFFSAVSSSLPSLTPPGDGHLSPSTAMAAAGGPAAELERLRQGASLKRESEEKREVDCCSHD